MLNMFWFCFGGFLVGVGADCGIVFGWLLGFVIVVLVAGWLSSWGVVCVCV